MNNSEILQIAKDVLQTEAAALNDIIGELNEQFAEAAFIVSDAKKLIVSGVGKSGIIGRKIASTFASIGIPSFFMHPAEAMHGDLGIVQKDDVCILLSKSGSSDEITELLPYLKRRGAILISITGNKNSYLGRNSDYTINSHVANEGCPINTAPMASALVTLAIGDALAAAVMNIKGVTLEEFAKQHPMGQIGRNLTLTVKDVMHTQDRIPKVALEATLRQAIIEITDKSLGCVCIINESGYLTGIITDGDVRRILQSDVDTRLLYAVDIMTKRPVTIEENIQLGEALSVMENRERQINVLPVVNKDNYLIGVIRIHDIIQSGI